MMTLRNHFNNYDCDFNHYLADAFCFALMQNDSTQANALLAMDERIIPHLIEKFCDALDENNIPLMYALSNSGLIDINGYNAVGDTPLIHAIRSKTIKQQTFSILLGLPAMDVNQKDTNGTPPILLATNPNNVHKLIPLLRHPAMDVNASDKDGFTALMTSARYENSVIVSELLKHPYIDVNIRNRYGMTALMIMACFENQRNVERILNHPSAVISTKDHNGRTAHSHANLWGNIETGKIIKSFEIN